MPKRFCLALLISYAATSFAGVVHTPAVAPFSDIQIHGHVDVTLHTNTHQHTFATHGDPRDLSKLKWHIRQDVLVVDMPKHRPTYGPVHVDINTPTLRAFSYAGTGIVTGEHLQSKHLDLWIANTGKTMLHGDLNLNHLTALSSGFTQVSGIHSHNLSVDLAELARVQLVGIAGLRHLTMHGQGWLSAYWIKSDNLTIEANNSATLQLAGIAKHVDIELRDHAHFNGRYLRGQDVFVKTHDHAQADMMVMKREHALALDQSNIYEYNTPSMDTGFMAEAGSILPMGLDESADSTSNGK
jgi:ABC-type transporter Mla MlaB component